MHHLRENINSQFAQFGTYLIIFRKWVVIASLVLVGSLALTVPKLDINTTLESTFTEKDEALQTFQRFRDQFGRDDSIILMIKGADIFDTKFLSKLKQFHQDLENSIPMLVEVNSLVNVRNIEWDGGKMVVSEFLENLPRSPGEIERLKETALSKPLYSDYFITRNKDHVVIVVKTKAVSSLADDGKHIERPVIDTHNKNIIESKKYTRSTISQVENSAIIGLINDIAREYHSKDFYVSISGTPVYQFFVEPMLRTGMKKIGWMILGITAVFMSALFGRVSGVFLPQFIVIMALAATLGLMSITGTSLSSTTTMLPAFLLSVGLTAPIHFMVVFFKFQKQVSRHDAILETLKHSGLPIVMTSVTTVAGLLSFSFTNIAPIAHLGVFSALGVTICLFLSLVFLPSLLAILKIRPGKDREKRYETSFYNRVLMGLGRLGLNHSWKTILITGVIAIVLSIGVTRLNFSHHMLDYLPKDSKFKKDTRLIDQETKGFRSLEVMIDTGKENGVYEEEVISSLEKLESFAMAQKDAQGKQVVGKTFSLLNLIKEINQVRHGNIGGSYVIPEDNGLIRKDMEMFARSGFDDLEDYTDSRFKIARFTAMMFWSDAASDVEFVDHMRDFITELFKGNIDVYVTGAVSLASRALDSMMSSLAIGYLAAGIMITIMMILFIGDFKLGLTAMIPNLLPVVSGLGIMGLMDIPLNTYNLIGGSIVLGLAVDDTIHFFHNFKQNYLETGDITTAVEETLKSTGRALLTTTLILVSCFWLRLFDDLKVISDFGLVMGISLSIAFLADVLLAPALLNVILRKDRLLVKSYA